MKDHLLDKGTNHLPLLLIFLNPLRDQVLFLKHNFNARAIASQQTELTRIQTDASRLIWDMEIAMQEADSFIQTLKAE
ncbi:MAG: DUF2959 family protein [Desulfuromusa sp.]|nr:DUF2959 family protein [Desulfuromusa sp.]